jgi:hypothetical protein
MATLAPLTGIVTLVTACGPTITAPDVVGMRLDEAHRTFEALGVEDFDDVDVIGEEDAIFRDANWVVVKQEPAAGTKNVDTGTTIRLEVGNEDDSEVLKMIPEDSDFAREMAPDEEEEPSEEPQPTESTDAEHARRRSLRLSRHPRRPSRRASTTSQWRVLDARATPARSSCGTPTATTSHRTRCGSAQATCGTSVMRNASPAWSSR